MGIGRSGTTFSYVKFKVVPIRLELFYFDAKGTIW